MSLTKRFLLFFCAGILLLGTLAACKPAPDEQPDTETTDQTEQTTQPSESEQPEVLPPEFEVGELTLTAAADLYPDFKPDEQLSVKSMEKIELRVEAEDHFESTIPFVALSGPEFSGNVMMTCVHVAPAQGWDYTYAASYYVYAPKAGSYELVVLSSDLKKEYTSDYFIEVNGKRALAAADKFTVLEHFASPSQNDNNLFKVMSLGTLTLSEGENVVTFTVDNVDSQNAWNRISFFLDYFTLTFVDKETPADTASVSYAVTPEGEQAELLQAAATVGVFDTRMPLSICASAYFEKAGEQQYTVTDYYGNVIWQGKVNCTDKSLVTLTKTVKNHPTGYFTLRLGEVSYRYVVMPSLSDRTLTDSPFAMDYAAYYLVKDPDTTFAIAAAARMAGVTWVRERADWRTYEPSKGTYDFTSTEAVYRAIDKAGLKNLAMICAAPSWATDPTGAQGMAGGFANTQLEIYQTTKAMAEYYAGIVDAWELWNESDHGFALETAELYAAWYKAAALGVLAADPNATVSFGGFCQPDANIDYVHLSMLNDLMSYSSIFNYHAHTAQSTQIPDFSRLPMVEGTYGTLTHYNAHNKPVWLTEAGLKIMSTTPSDDQVLAQAPYIVTSTVQSLAMGSDKHFWFVLAPYTEAGGDFGTFSSDLQPRPTLAAEATMTRVLGQGKYLGELCDVPDGAYGYVFYTGSRAASVLWAAQPTAYAFDAEQAVIVTDMMGTDRLVKPENGKITLEIGVDPVFVTYSIAPAYQSKQTADATVQPLQVLSEAGRVILCPVFEGYDINDGVTKEQGHKIGDGTKIRLYVTNLNDKTVSGSVSVTLEGFEVQGCEGEISVAPMSQTVVELTLRQNGGQGIDGYILFTGEFGGQAISPSAAHVYSDTPAKTKKIKFIALRDGKEYTADALGDVGIKFSDAKGAPVAYVNGERIDTVTLNGSDVVLDLSGIGEGKHTVVAGLVSEAGDLRYTVFYVTCQDGKVVFDLP